MVTWADCASNEEYHTAWMLENKDRLREQRKLRYADIYQRRRELRLQRAGRAKPDKCEVCGVREDVVFDHCHVSNKFRGWLCNGCNTALGYAHDNPDTLRKLAEYLEQHAET